MTRATALVVHGHFYQPPRENPWTGIVEREPSAQPFHDWNERIHAECYRRNAHARVLDDHGRISRMVDNYRLVSFNFGPTLLSWLAARDPSCYRRILRADAESARTRGGHGNAIAQAYNHAILPLCNDRDLRTQVRWGLADFEHRFGRKAESMWLPETACDVRTLVALCDEGLRYAILAPEQAARVRRKGDKEWQELAAGAVDPGRPYLWRDPGGSGRSIALFFYDGPVARSIAFEGVLSSSSALVDRFELAKARPGEAVIVATDGESYGHHFKAGERCLAYALEVEAPRRGFRVTNLGELLGQRSPTWEVELALGPDGKGTSWSCAHGVGRWFRDCGCHTGGRPGWTQTWRTPLRLALDTLRDFAASTFEDAGSDLFHDPWAARDAYIQVLLSASCVPRGLEPPEAARSRRGTACEAFLSTHGRGALGVAARARALCLLEAQRSAQLMYTSCGWFFSDISGIESTQVLRYAGVLLDQLEELGFAPPRERFMEVLSEARSNAPRQETGADLFRRAAQASRATDASIAAHVGISRLSATAVGGGGARAHAGDGVVIEGELAGRFYRVSGSRLARLGGMKLATARVELRRAYTGIERDYAVAAVHLGGIDVHCALRPFSSADEFARASDTLFGSFATASVATLVRALDTEFGPEGFGLAHIVGEARPGLVRDLFAPALEAYAADYERIYEDNRRVIAMLADAGLMLPRELRIATQFTLNRRLLIELGQQSGDEVAGYREALALAEQAERLGFSLRDAAPRERFEAMLLGFVAAWALAAPDGERHWDEEPDSVTDADQTGPERRPAERAIARALELLRLTERLRVEPDLERCQELVYGALCRLLPEQRDVPRRRFESIAPAPPSTERARQARIAEVAPLALTLGLSETLLVGSPAEHEPG